MHALNLADTIALSTRNVQILCYKIEILLFSNLFSFLPQPPTFGCQDNAVESVKLSLSGDQGQLIKQLLSNTAARRSAMCATVTSKGQGQLLAISQDKGKVSGRGKPQLAGN